MSNSQARLRLPVVPLPFLLLSLWVVTGCATFSGDMEGAFTGSGRPAPAAEEVSVLFLLRHVRQAHGMDAIPKLMAEPQIVRDFDNLLVDAVSEISNLSSYTSFTEFPSDVSDPERVARRDDLIRTRDFVVRVDLLEEYSFVRQFFGRVLSVVSATAIPVPYRTRYSIDVRVTQGGEELAAYHRSNSKTLWVQAFLLFVQPFRSDALVKERIYIDLLHDVFREMEADGVLNLPGSTGDRIPGAHLSDPVPVGK